MWTPDNASRGRGRPKSAPQDLDMDLGDLLSDSPAVIKKKPSSADPSKKRVSDEDFYSMLGKDMSDESDVSDAGAEDVKKMTVGLDDLDAELMGSLGKKKSPLKQEPVSGKPPRTPTKSALSNLKKSNSDAMRPSIDDIMAKPDSFFDSGGAKKDERPSSAPVSSPLKSTDRPSSAPTSSTIKKQPPKKIDFGKFDEDDPLAGLLSDDEDDAPKAKSKVSAAPSKPEDIPEPPSSRPGTSSGLDDDSLDREPLPVRARAVSSKAGPPSSRTPSAASRQTSKGSRTGANDEDDDDDDDIFGNLGLDDSTPKKDTERRPSISAFDELLGKSSTPKKKPAPAQRKEFTFDKKPGEKEESTDEKLRTPGGEGDEFLFGEYLPSATSSRQSSRRSVRFTQEDDMKDNKKGRLSSTLGDEQTTGNKPTQQRPLGLASTGELTNKGGSSGDRDDWLGLGNGSGEGKGDDWFDQVMDSSTKSKISSKLAKENSKNSDEDWMGLGNTYTVDDSKDGGKDSPAGRKKTTESKKLSDFAAASASDDWLDMASPSTSQRGSRRGSVDKTLANEPSSSGKKNAGPPKEDDWLGLGASPAPTPLAGSRQVSVDGEASKSQTAKEQKQILSRSSSKGADGADKNSDWLALQNAMQKASLTTDNGEADDELPFVEKKSAGRQRQPVGGVSGRKPRRDYTKLLGDPDDFSRGDSSLGGGLKDERKVTDSLVESESVRLASAPPLDSPVESPPMKFEEGTTRKTPSAAQEDTFDFTFDSKSKSRSGRGFPSERDTVGGTGRQPGPGHSPVKERSADGHEQKPQAEQRGNARKGPNIDRGDYGENSARGQDNVGMNGGTTRVAGTRRSWRDELKRREGERDGLPTSPQQRGMGEQNVFEEQSTIEEQRKMQRGEQERMVEGMRRQHEVQMRQLRDQMQFPPSFAPNPSFDPSPGPNFNYESSGDYNPTGGHNPPGSYDMNLWSQIKRLQMEKDHLKGMMECLQRSHTEELAALTKSHQSRLQITEETFQRREERLKQETEDVIARGTDRQRQSDEEKSRLSTSFHDQLDNVGREKQREIERLREQHRSDLKSLRVEYESAITRFKKTKEQEVDALAHSQSHMGSFNVLIDKMRQNTEGINVLHHTVASKHSTVLDERERATKSMQEQLKILQSRLLAQQTDNDKERGTLQELIVKMDVQMNEQGLQLKQEQWNLSQEKTKVASLQKSLEEERTILNDQISKERMMMQRSKDALISEQQTMLAQLCAERKALAEERSQFTVAQRMLIERENKETITRAKATAEYEGLLSDARTQKEAADTLQQNSQSLEEKARRELDRLTQERTGVEKQKARLEEVALQLRKRSEDIEHTCREGAKAREDGSAALIEARRVQASEAQRLTDIQARLDALTSKQQQISEEKLLLAKERKRLEKLKTTVLCTSCRSPVRDLPPQPIAFTPASLTPSKYAVAPHVVKMKIQADRDDEALHEESIYLEALKYSPYHQGSHDGAV